MNAESAAQLTLKLNAIDRRLDQMDVLCGMLVGMVRRQARFLAEVDGLIKRAVTENADGNRQAGPEADTGK